MRVSQARLHPLQLLATSVSMAVSISVLLVKLRCLLTCTPSHRLERKLPQTKMRVVSTTEASTGDLSSFRFQSHVCFPLVSPFRACSPTGALFKPLAPGVQGDMNWHFLAPSSSLVLSAFHVLLTTLRSGNFAKIVLGPGVVNKRTTAYEVQ